MNKMMKQTEVARRAPGRKRTQVPDNGKPKCPVDAGKPRMEYKSKHLVLVGYLGEVSDETGNALAFAVDIDTEQIARIKRMCEVVEKGIPRVMYRFDQGPYVYTGPRNMSPDGFALGMTGAPEDCRVHLDMCGVDIEEIPVIDGNPSKHRVPIHNSYLVIEGNGSFCWMLEIENFGVFYTEYYPIEQFEDWARGKSPERTI